MSLRRGLMMAMAGGAQFVKGSFTVPSTGECVLEFGKTFSQYLFVVEMDDATKTDLINSGQTGNRAYAIFGVYPIPEINNSIPNTYPYARVNPSTGDVSISENAAFVSEITSHSITFTVGTNYSSGAAYLYRNKTYNYYIVEIK